MDWLSPVSSPGWTCNIDMCPCRNRACNLLVYVQHSNQLSPLPELISYYFLVTIDTELFSHYSSSTYIGFGSPQLQNFPFSDVVILFFLWTFQSWNISLWLCVEKSNKHHNFDSWPYSCIEIIKNSWIWGYLFLVTCNKQNRIEIKQVIITEISICKMKRVAQVS